MIPVGSATSILLGAHLIWAILRGRKDDVLECPRGVRYLLSGHARKAEEWAVFETAVRAADPDPCPSGRTICADKVS